MSAQCLYRIMPYGKYFCRLLAHSFTCDRSRISDTCSTARFWPQAVVTLYIKHCYQAAAGLQTSPANLQRHRLPRSKESGKIPEPACMPHYPSAHSLNIFNIVESFSASPAPWKKPSLTSHKIQSSSLLSSKKS